MIRLILIAVPLVLAGVVLADEQSPEGSAAPDGLHPRVKLETSRGDIVLELDAEKAPITVQNFVQYVEDGFYNGTIFHRVIPTFMIQGGGYLPDISEKKEGLRPPIKNEWRNGLKNVRGSISMARLGGNADSATAQFFINVVDNARLDTPQPDGAAYAVFGKVVEGMDVVDNIKSSATRADPKLQGMGEVVPVDTVTIKSAKMLTPLDKDKVKAVVSAAEQSAAAAAGAAKAAEEKQLQDVIAKAEAEAKGKFAKTPSGLMWLVLKEGSGASPQPTDRVEVHYTGWLVNGEKFDSSVDRGAPATFGLNQVIKGWTEGVGMMKIGEKRKLIIPPELGYGARGAPGAIPPNATLIFDVELLAIK